MNSDGRNNRNGRTVVLAGLGNIGSQVVPLVSRLPEIGRLILIDPDRYGPENLHCQNMAAADLDCLKVDAMARQVSAVRPGLFVETYAHRIEDVPLALLKSDAIVGCVDSRLARQSINSIAFRLGAPWIDGAVDGASGFGRLAGYAPGGACLECQWGDADYLLVEPVYSCQGADARQGTNAHAELGALVAAHQVIALRELLAGKTAFTDCGYFINTVARETFRSKFRRNEACRFDHGRLEVLGTRNRCETLGQLQIDHGADGIGIEGHGFAAVSVCRGCRTQLPHPPVLTRGFDPGVCPTCGGVLIVLGLSVREIIEPRHWPDLTLTDIGLRNGDIVRLLRPEHPDVCIEIGRP